MLPLLYVLVSFVGMIAVACYILAPINAVAGHVPLVRKFRLIDFVCLLIFAQGVFGASAVAFRDGLPGAGAAVLILLGLLAVVIWGVSIATLDKIGIDHSGKRLVFQLVVVPASLLLMIALPLSLAMAIGLLISESVAEPAPIAAVLASASGMIAAAYFMRRLAEWIVRK